MLFSAASIFLRVFGLAIRPVPYVEYNKCHEEKYNGTNIYVVGVEAVLDDRAASLGRIVSTTELDSAPKVLETLSLVLLPLEAVAAVTVAHAGDLGQQLAPDVLPPFLLQRALLVDCQRKLQ